jgi:hypothetical protein
MSNVVPDTQQEFWRPPVIARAAISTAAPIIAVGAADSCADCRTEFMPESRFCYVCGTARAETSEGWTRYFNFVRVLGFQSIKRSLGLPVPSLIGFLAGIGCLAAAVGVGRVLTTQTVTEYQALELMRIEWLLGSVASFLAGILLRNAGSK